MKNFIMCLSILFLAQFGFAQTGTFTMTVSQDTILLGNHFDLEYEIKNLKGSFEAPELSSLNIVGGPNSSSHMSYVNGKVSQSQSYSYVLSPTEIGVYTILPAFLTVGDDVMETEPVDIIVIPNPEGIVQSAQSKKNGISDQQIKINQSPKGTPSKSKRVRKKF